MKSYTTILFLLIVFSLQAQNEYEITLTPADTIRHYNIKTAEKQLREILDFMGLRADYTLITRINLEKTANATFRHGLRRISLNPVEFQAIYEFTGTYRATQFVLAHELVHHLNDDVRVSIGSKDQFRQNEKDADWGAGTILARMGATLKETTAVMDYFQNFFDTTEERSSHRYMSSERRKAHITKAWRAAQPICKKKRKRLFKFKK